MATRRRGGCITTYSGRNFWPADPHAGDVSLEDVAHHLACINRFNGALSQPYSVAQHSVLVSEHCPAEHALVGLLHDATEAYLGDIVTPLKRELRAAQLIEGRIWTAVAAAFGIPEAMPDIVHQVDRRALATEALQLHPQGQRIWWAIDRPEPLPVEIRPLPWHEAKAAFLNAFQALTPSL